MAGTVPEFTHATTRYVHTFTFPDGTTMTERDEQLELRWATVEVQVAEDDEDGTTLIFTQVEFYAYELTKSGRRAARGNIHGRHLTQYLSPLLAYREITPGGLLTAALIRAALDRTADLGPYPLADQQLLNDADAAG